MKKLLLGTMLLAFVTVVSVPATAQVSINVNVGTPLPPPIAFNAPPDVVALPDTNDVYACPEIGVDLFFYNGWWWRLWEGRWYRSHYYDRGWGYFNHVPRFYSSIDPGWRGYYQNHSWRGHPWNYERIPHQQLQQNWKSWHTNQYWSKQKSYGVQNYQPRNVQRQPQRVQQRQPQRVQQPQRQPQERVQQPQRQEQRPQAQRPQASQPRGEPAEREEEHRR